MKCRLSHLHGSRLRAEVLLEFGVEEVVSPSLDTTRFREKFFNNGTGEEEPENGLLSYCELLQI